MNNTKTSLAQSIVNKINSRENFTHKLTKNNYQYVVSINNLYEGKNPSLVYNMLTKVNKVLKENNDYFDSIGGWLDTETKKYYVDLNFHINNLNLALSMAKLHQQLAIYDIENNIEIKVI